MTEAEPAVPAAAKAAGLGDKLALWYVENGKVKVGVTDASGGVVTELRARLGTDAEIFQHAPIESATRLTPAPADVRIVTGAAPQRAGKAVAAATTATRLLDSVPYAGGDRITSIQTISGTQYVVQCTVSVKVLPDSGGDAMLSAGHCGPTGTVWYQGYYDSGTVYNTGILGSTTTMQWGNGRLDGELIQGSQYGYFPYAYTTLTGLESVTGIAVTGTGSKVCTDGSFTGYKCGATITKYNVCANITEGTTVYSVCHLDIAGASSQIVQPGDSGGPVFYPNSTTDVALAGTISAQSNNGREVLFSDAAYLQSTLGVVVPH
ncbi:hypothetical protein [Actinoplanes sp. NPDC026623]|uniref:hypothetical protein n=1 Tax=Actinoplanes sp. NPDC026623 TaxID=3155610 RepID=UPI0033F081F4